MALITSAAIADNSLKQFVGGITPIYQVITLANLPAVVTNGDRIQIANLPANAHVSDLKARVVGASGVTSLCQFQITEPTGNSISLSATTLAPSTALVALLTTPHSPITSVTGTRSLELNVISGTFSVTAVGVQLIVEANYNFIGTITG